MKGLEFAIIPGGCEHNDAAWNFAGYGFATQDKKTRDEAWMTFPLPCYVIHHPTAGYIMFDVGCGLREEIDRRPAEHRNINPVTINREDYVDESLKRMGLSVDEVSAIILSHCHWDHVGGLEFFHGTKAIQNIYVSEQEFARALVHSHKTSKGYIDSLYYRWNMDVPDAEYHFVEEEGELFPGVEVLMMEGHSPCMLVLLLHCEEKNYIIPSDAVTAACCLDGRYEPGTIYDSLGYHRTVERLKKLQKKYQAEIIFQHDPESFSHYRTMEWLK